MKLAVGLLLVSVVTANAATPDPSHPTWAQMAPKCAEELAEEVHCASCNGYWPVIARCAISRSAPEIPSDSIELCISRVKSNDRNLPLAHDRVADVAACLDTTY